MVKQYTPEISTPSDATAFKPVEPGDITQSSGKWENMAFEGDLAAAVMAAQWAANEAGEYASSAQKSEKISTTNKDETGVLKDQTDIASKDAQKSEEKSKKILVENTQKAKQVAANLAAVGDLAEEVALKKRQTSETLLWAKEAKAAAENAAEQAIAAARAMGEPQQKQI